MSAIPRIGSLVETLTHMKHEIVIKDLQDLDKVMEVFLKKIGDRRSLLSMPRWG